MSRVVAGDGVLVALCHLAHGSLRVQVDPLADAAEAHPSALVRVLDLPDRFCREETCYSTVGGLIVYFDGGHMSASYARTLAPALAPEVSAALGRRGA